VRRYDRNFRRRLRRSFERTQGVCPPSSHFENMPFPDLPALSTGCSHHFLLCQEGLFMLGLSTPLECPQDKNTPATHKHTSPDDRSRPLSSCKTQTAPCRHPSRYRQIQRKRLLETVGISSQTPSQQPSCVEGTTPMVPLGGDNRRSFCRGLN